ncbi:MAG TPA: 1-acyl-sn-glycerol-3-phosphate acyltransferase [Candidatus Binatia bacterium]|nr:1-acyl-sn-glycerol-3-phosphate acyltransferase [Candidatus Binatia bacterium]
MAKSDGDAPDRDGQPAVLRVYRGGRARGSRRQPASPEEVARRLSALERRVERALGSGAGDDAPDLLGRLADQTLSVFASARRFDVGQDVGAALVDALYRFWWRVDAAGLERVPATGAVILVTNRGGALLPYEALMLQVALAARRGRGALFVVDDWLGRLPLLGSALARLGGVRGTPGQLRRLLAEGEAVIVAPEVGQPKRFSQRYRVASFGRGGFARLAIETGAAVVPVAVIGAEEVHPLLARVDLPGRLLGLPTLPITPTFPWLGLAGLVPLPTKWLLLAGEPIDVAGRHPAADAADVATVGRLRDQARERLQALVLEGLRRRRSLFLG